MKLRILANSVRLRLDADEVAQIGRGEAVREQTRFPGGVLACCLSADGEELAARFTPASGIEIMLPAQRAVSWAAGGEVSIHGSVAVDDGWLEVLVEKDLRADRR